MKKILICTACVVALSSASAPARTTTERDAAARVAAKPELIVRARQSAAQPGAGRAAAGQQIKLFAPATVAQALPGAPGAVKNDAGFDQDPMQCTTGQDGACAIALPKDQFPVSATYEVDADVAEQAGVNAWPGPAAGPVASLFAFGFMPAMPLTYGGVMLNPGATNFRSLNDVLIATDGTKWCTYGDGGPQSTPITPKSPQGGHTTDGGKTTVTTTTTDEPFPPPPPEPVPPDPEPELACTVPQKSTVFFNTHTEETMNFPKRCLFKFAVRRSPFSLIRAPALPPGVLAVAAAFPHFNHADAGAGDSAVACAVPVKPRPLFLRLALNIPRLPRCLKYRAISLNDLK